MKYCIILFIFIPIIQNAMAQGPRAAWFYNPQLDMDWASCYVYLDGGTRAKLPFFPMINYKGSPCGSDQYKKNIDIKGTVYFAGNGTPKENRHNGYRAEDISGKIIMFSYDFPDSTNHEWLNSISLEKRINDLVHNGAAAIVLFWYHDPYPVQRYMVPDYDKIPEIPIININLDGASTIFTAAGRDTAKVFTDWRLYGQFKPEALICKLALRIDSKFNRIESKYFTICYQEKYINKDEIEKLAELNNRSVQFILNVFKDIPMNWNKTFTTYYRDYDSKLFFLCHWGKGLSFKSGVFMVYDGSSSDFGLMVHENTHKLINDNWGGSTSFMTEGLGRYTEALAGDTGMNHRATADFMKNNQLYPLQDMLSFEIGKSGMETRVGYPASGSLTAYLIEHYSLDQFKQLYQQQAANQDKTRGWKTIFGKSLNGIEKEWRQWLETTF